MTVEEGSILKLVTGRRVVALFWIGSIISLVALASQDSPGWDTDVYWAAIKSVSRGGNPYAEGIAVQKVFHDQKNKDPHAHPPMTYVYSPITLPVLNILGKLPAWLLGTSYYCALIVGFALQMWAVWKMATVHERRWLPFLLPAAAYFPGFLNDDVILSGNIVYLLYGLVLAAAIPGWKRNQWGWYYLAVLAASICKAPLLTLLAFPAILGRRQWVASGAVGAAGLALFFVQARLWPTLFAQYMQAVQLQFDWNADFGFGPAGVLGLALQNAGMSYTIASEAIYVGFAIAMASVLFWLSRVLQANDALRDAAVPLILVGTVLLNPRVKEYDVAAITIPMALIIARFLQSGSEVLRELQDRRKVHLAHQLGSKPRSELAERPRIDWRDVPTIVGVGGWFLIINLGATDGPWKPIELALLVFVFAIGTWVLIHQARELRQEVPASDSISAEINLDFGLDPRRLKTGV